MKKTLLILVVLALLAPTAALAATEFSLGGFIKLDMFWDSSQDSKNAFVALARNNDALFHHGNFDITAQGSRFNFTIKGPKLWGATTTGFIEIDFDTLGDNNFSSVTGAVGQPAVTNPFVPRLRHAMFRLNWPETELMLGQYWGLFSEFAPECTGDATFLFHGWTFQRVPQIRITQKFLGNWTVAAIVAKPNDPAGPDINFGAAGGALPVGAFGAELNSGLQGRSTETPQLQGKLAYEADLYGKAAFYGRPRGFVAQVNAGWQRYRYRNNAVGASLFTFGQNAFGTTTTAGVGNLFQQNQQYLDPWCIQGTLFIPVIPTHTANLAGTASITAEYYIGQGVSFLGAARDQENSWLEFNGINAITGNRLYNRRLTNQFGGYLQGQYWFTNQWYMTAIWAFNRNYGFSQSRDFTAVSTGNPFGYVYAANADQVKLWSEYNLTLWYRPIEALKFGLTYAYERTDYLQKLNNPVPFPAVTQTNAIQPNTNAKDFGDSHRVQFVAYMYF